MKLSPQAKILWAKSPNRYAGAEAPEGGWLPLYMHMSDSVEIASLIWDNWVPPGTKNIIGFDDDSSKKIFLFCAAVHDIGKAAPAFQIKVKELWQEVLRCGLKEYPLSNTARASHGLTGHVIIREQLVSDAFGFSKENANTIAAVVGGHHGVPPDSMFLDDLSSFGNDTGMDKPEWARVQQELFEYTVALSGIDLAEYKDVMLSVSAQVILTGLVIMTDWLASNEELFPHCSREYPRMESSSELAADAWEKLWLPPYWIAEELQPDVSVADFFHSRFDLPQGSTPRPVQRTVVDVLRNIKSPGIVVIEAPMGEGKTEAALLAAEIMASKTGRGGAFVALPTQATTDGIFPRIENWINKIDTENHALYLAHGKARFNDAFRNLATLPDHLNIWDEDENEKESGEEVSHSGAIAHEWLQGRKKGLLSDFVVGTVDQILMTALRQRHLALRHLGLANKVVIIDECHAYDAYMYQYLEMALQWLGAYNVPVIVLSATLPSQKRQAVVDAYLWMKIEEVKAEVPEWAQTRKYPLITYSDGIDVRYSVVDASERNLCVDIEMIEDDVLVKMLEYYLSDGGCACVIRNTVKRAQETARELATRFGEDKVELFHAQFLSVDRIRKEKELRNKLGPNSSERPPIYIVVGTQVLEQSLDVDFDLTITDIAPIDLVIQRIGRLHRHERDNRPAKLARARCLISGTVYQDNDLPLFESGSETIYGRYLLESTFARLKSVKTINLPDDIPDLVQDVYSELGVTVPDDWAEDYKKAKEKHEKSIAEKVGKAKSFRLHDVDERESLIDWLNTRVSDSDAHGEASVRDTSDSIEVVVVQRRRNDRVYLLPWIDDSTGMTGAEIPIDRTPEDELAGIAASCTVKLPGILCAPWMIDAVITAIEKDAIPYIKHWKDSCWLRGELILMLDENLESDICGYRIKYEEKWGLSAERVKEDGIRKEI